MTDTTGEGRTVGSGQGRPRILVVNHWHDDNRGDSAITQGILSLLAEVYPGAAVTITTLWEEGTLGRGGTRHLAAAFPGIRVLPSPAPTELRGRRAERSTLRTGWDTAVWLARSAPSIRRVSRNRPLAGWDELVTDHDAVVVVGGSDIFDDRGVPAVLSLPRLLHVLGPARTAALRGRPVVLLGHTLGPFARPAGARLARRMLSGTQLAVVREAGSVAVARELGITQVQEAPDLAFALAPRRTHAVDRMLGRLGSEPGRTMAIAVRRHPTRGSAADDRLLREMADGVRRLLAAGDIQGVAVVPHTVGPTPVEDDRGISERLVRALAGLPVTLVTDDVAPAELSAFYGATAVVVAVRLHASILALNCGTPTFALSYLTAKTQGVMAQCGLPDAVGDYLTMTQEDLVHQVRRLLARPELRHDLQERAVQRREVLTRSARTWFTAAGMVTAEPSTRS